MDVPPNPTPDPVQNIFDSVIGVFSTYGWTILFFVVIVNLLWSHIQPKLREWQQRKEDRQKENEYVSDPNYLIEREAARMRAREKMLEDHLKKVEAHTLRKKEIEERKNRERLEKLEKMLHGKSTSKKSADDGFRPGYNPLTGSGGSSCNVRFSRRSGGGG